MNRPRAQQRLVRQIRGPAFGVLSLLVLALTTGCYFPAPSLQDDQVRADDGQGEPAQRGETRKRSDGFSDIQLYTQHGEPVRFYEDLVRDRAVLINFMYTTCPKICPGTTAQLAKINDSFGPWIGRDLFMLSISIDPEVDDPKRLKQYWELFGSKPGWLFLTGDYDEIDRLRRELGVYDLDPEIDADKTQHAGIVTFGNDRTDRWSALPVFMHRRLLAKTVLDTTWDGQWTTSAAPAAEYREHTKLFYGRGVVRDVFSSKGEVLISHEDIPGLMMAMTMVFPVEDPSLLAGLAVGDSVEFTLELVGAGQQIVSIATSRHGQDEVRGAGLSQPLSRAARQASG